MADSVLPIKDPNILKKLEAAWDFYKKNMIEDGRPLAEPDKSDLDFDENRKERVTYSESVAYVLMRAVMINDQATFTKVWNWAQKNMQRNKIEEWYTCTDANIKFTNKGKRYCNKWTPEKVNQEYSDHLFAWRYVPSLRGTGGKGGIISYKAFSDEMDRNGYNAASDDIEIAAALYLAYRRNWGNNYLKEAQAILDDAWKKYVVKIEDQYILYAGDQFSVAGVINASYFRPAYFSRIFPAIEASKDPAARHPWQEITQSSYEIINASGDPKLFLNGKSGAGVNLPSDWLAKSYTGELTESSFFPGAAGENFGWDAYRTLYAVGQDFLWYSTDSARTYLTDCKVGPLCFLQGNISRTGVLPSGFTHDGKRVHPDPKIAQTRELNVEQLAFYGGYLPFFHAAGKRNETQAILARLNRAYDKKDKGFWGDDPENYFTQNWVWFGLMMVYNNGLPIGLEKQIQDLPAPPARVVKGPERKWSPPAYLQPDLEVGLLTRDGRPKLKGKWIEDKLSLEQLGRIIKAIDQFPYAPLGKGDKDFRQLLEVYKLEEKSKFKLLAYLNNDPNEYWNNLLVILRVYTQKLIEENKEEEFENAIQLCQKLRARIASQLKELPASVQKGFAPNPYQRVVLDMAEAELRAQVKKKGLDFYQQGIDLATDAIKNMLAITSREARPDYHFVARALLTMGDLYMSMHSAKIRRDLKTGKEYAAFDTLYMDRAMKFFSFVEKIEEQTLVSLPFVSLSKPGEGKFVINQPMVAMDNEDFLKHMHALAMVAEKGNPAVEVPLVMGDEGLYLEISPKIIDDALSFNYQKGHLDPEEMEEAQKASAYLKGIAMAKKVSAFLQKSDKKHIPEIREQIKYCDEALKIIEKANEGKTKPDFFVYFAKNLKADLLLALAGEIKYHPELQAELTEDEVSLLAEAEKLYSETPSKFNFLYAWSRTKIAEIAMRKGNFTNQEFTYLFPFYTKPLSGRNPIPGDEFLGLQIDYTQALLFISTRGKLTKEEATKTKSSPQAVNLAKAAILLGGSVPRHLIKDIFDEKSPEVINNLGRFFENPNAEQLVFKPGAEESIKNTVGSENYKRILLDLFTVYKRSPNGVLKNAEMLPHPLYRRYFKLQAELKLLEIDIRNKQHTVKGGFAKIEQRFKKLEVEVKQFSSMELEEISWNPNAFLAELYNEWASVVREAENIGKANPHAKNALDYSCQSDSAFDHDRRIDEIKHEFHKYLKFRCDERRVR